MIVRILLADDHKIIVDGLRSLLEKNNAFKVIGQASDGLSAVRLAAELSPDLVIMDISLPGLNGIDATRRILEANSRVKVIALSMHKDGRYIAEALKSGAAGYLLKESAFDELTAAIRTVMKGACYLSAAIADLVIKDYIRHLEKTDSGVFSVLTPREREVLQSLSEGLSTKQIAARLGVSVKTVETYRVQIMEKLDIHSVAELTKYAIREGITSL
jgi:DNA-binding NarL/FixJ family response regulator